MAQTAAKTALVTGGTGGLGAAVTGELLGSGWRVVVPWVAERELERVERRDDLVLVQADCLDPAQAATAVDAAGEELHAVVNLIGGFAQGERVHETPIEDFEQMLRLNLRPAYLVCAAALPRLMAAGESAIVCVSARAAAAPFPGAAGYAVAKAAVLAFVDALNAEYRDDGVRANAIMPSVIDTPANRAAMPKADPSRWVRPEEIARTIRWLCSDEASATSGAHVPVYGRA